MEIANPQYNHRLEGVKVKPNTEYGLNLVYSLSQGMDGSNYLDRNKNKDSLKMYLTVSLYPVKKTIELNLDMTL